MAERVIKPKVKTGNNTADEIKIPYNVLSNPPDLSVYVTTENTTQNIGGKKTVVTPPATDDSTQIANTSWVRTNYQEKGYAGIDGDVVNSDGKVTDKDGKVVDALYFKVASLTTSKAYLRTYLLAEVAMTNIVKEQATVLIRCTTESSTSAPNVTITLDNYSYASLLLPKNIFVTADYKSGTAGATFTVWVKQDKDFMQQVWNVLSQNTRNYTTTSKREWSVFYSNITKATAVTDINAAPTGYTRIVANNNNRYSNLEENTYLWQQSQNAGITWKRYSDNTTRGVFRHYDDGTTENFVVQSDGFLFRPLNNNNTKSIKVDPKTGALYPEKDLGADLGKTAQRWNNGYITNIKGCKVINDDGDNLTINGTTTVVTPQNKDNSNQVATTAWAGRRYKSIADFGFTSQTTVKAIVQKIIDNWYEYCTFACTNDNFNNFSDTPDGYGTLIIEVGSNALRPFISFTKQIGDSNSYKYWQANIVRSVNNQVTEIQWYQIINDTLPQTISGEKTFTNNTAISNNSTPTYSLIDTGLVNGTNPTKVRDVQVIGRDKNNLALTGWRGWVSTTGYTSSQLYARSFGTDYSNFVALYAIPKAPTYDTTSTETQNKTGANSPNIWYFAPSKSDRFNLGASNQRWNNAYVKNIVADNIPLIPFYSDSLSTGTYRSTKLPSGHSLIYIEDRERRLSGYFYQGSGQLGFQELYFITNFYTDSTGQTTLTIYKLRINGTQVEKTYKYLFVSSSGAVEVGTEYAENGTFYYKVLK